MGRRDLPRELAGVRHEPRAAILDFKHHPAIAIVNILAAGLMEICGPLFWEALILFFIYAEF